MQNNLDNKKTAAHMRRNFLKAATLLGLGTIAAGTDKSYTGISRGSEEEKRYRYHIDKEADFGFRKNPLVVSAIQLGCMGMHVGRDIHADHKSMVKQIRDAAERGCDFFDTAEVYGPYVNEELVREALAHIRNQVVISISFVLKSADLVT